MTPEERNERLRDLILTDDEIEYLSKSGRCRLCGHLSALHNFHCCEFCMVDGCGCEL